MWKCLQMSMAFSCCMQDFISRALVNQALIPSYLRSQVSRQLQQSRGALLLTVHRGRPVAAPGAAALTPAARLLAPALSSTSTASAVPAQLRRTTFLRGFPHRRALEGPPGGVVSQQPEQTGTLVLGTVPVWQRRAPRTGGGARWPVLPFRRGLKWWRGGWGWSRRGWSHGKASYGAKLLAAPLAACIQTSNVGGKAPWIWGLAARRYPDPAVQRTLPPAVVEPGWVGPRATQGRGVEAVIGTGQRLQRGGAGHRLIGEVQPCWGLRPKRESASAAHVWLAGGGTGNAALVVPSNRCAAAVGGSWWGQEGSRVRTFSRSIRKSPWQRAEAPELLARLQRDNTLSRFSRSEASREMRSSADAWLPPRSAGTTRSHDKEGPELFLGSFTGK